jgi:hypothetical protein
VAFGECRNPCTSIVSGRPREDISRVDTPRIHQDFNRIGVDVSDVFSGFCLRTVSRNPPNQHRPFFGSREYATGGDRFSDYFRTAGIRCRTTDNQRIFQPMNDEDADVFPPPAPASPPASLVQLKSFNGLDPNGTWSLYVVDDASDEVGTIAGGWELAVSTSRPAVPLDFDGDRVSDPTLFHAASGVWYIANQFSRSTASLGVVPVPGDYDGDGVTDIAVFRPDGRWEVMGQMSPLWGAPGDLPVPGDFNGDGVTDVAVFRPSTAEWFVKDQFTVTWGAQGDIPPSPAYAPR